MKSMIVCKYNIASKSVEKIPVTFGIATKLLNKCAHPEIS